MTTLGSLTTTAPQPLDIGSLVASINLPAGTLGPASLLASLTAWANQDDDAHEMCSLVACRTPLHPGPCKGWKHTLHATSPHIWKQMEDERVRKGNERRLKRIGDLKAQGKPIPRRLLTEIKAKPAPAGQHPATKVTAVPLGKVGQKADLAGGQAHHAGQAVSNAAGVVPNQAPALPLGPKGKKPTVAGRGPAFVITQPKVTDTYKLDKAAKLTPQEWASLSSADKNAIRDELEAIKVRGFGPQQKKADELLAKLPAGNSIANLATQIGQNKAAGQGKVAQALQQSLANPKITHLGNIPGKTNLGKATKAVPAAPASSKPDVTDQVKKALDPAAKLTPAARLFVHRKMDKKQFDSLDAAAQKQVLADLDHQVANGSGPQTKQLAQDLKDRFQPGASGTPSTPNQAAPASSPGLKPSAPLAPLTAPHIQHAAAVANRTAPKAQMAKTQIDSYGKLTKAEFDALPDGTKKSIRDDLANAKAKFLDPKKQQEAADLLSRFGSSHPTSAPAAPNGAKGYSDPMSEVVKATSSGLVVTDDVLSSVARLTPDQVGKLDHADRMRVLGRLALIATDPKAAQDVKDRAAAYGRIINGGTHVPASQKFDHAPSIGELHREEQKGGHAATAAALVAAHDTAMDRGARIQALTALTKPQFDTLGPDEQRQLTDALQGLHYTAGGANNGYTSSLNGPVGAAITTYTGMHPGVHRLQQAEADFRAGKIDGNEVRNAYHRAAVQAPGTTDKAGEKLVADEAHRIAVDNPTLPTHARVRMAGDQPYGNSAYAAIAAAGMPHNWEPAPRLSGGDLRQIFQVKEADLAKADPIHAQAVRDLQEHVLLTGLRGQPGVPTGSPWSQATRNAAVDALLDINGAQIPQARLDRFHALSPAAQSDVKRILRERIANQTNSHAKLETHLTLAQLDGKTYSPSMKAALIEASETYPVTGKLDVYRAVDPAEFQQLPAFAQDAIKNHLADLQHRAEQNGPVSFGPADNPFKVMPAALAAHLDGSRVQYMDRQERKAADVANYGTKIVGPSDRTDLYAAMGAHGLTRLASGDAAKVTADLAKIQNDSSLTYQQRYSAALTKDFKLASAPITNNFNPTQISAIGAVNPANALPDNTVARTLGHLDKADYDSLDKAYRDAIDQRILSLPGTDQQAINANLHPSAVANTPSGTTPTTVQANIPVHVQDALDTIYGVHPKSHTMAHQLSTYGALRGHDFSQFNAQEQGHVLGDLSFIATTAKGPSGDKARKLIDRFTPPGTPSGHIPTGAVIPPANAVPGQVRYATPLKGLEKAKDSGKSGDGWISLPGGGRVWGAHGAAGLMLQHVDPQTGEKRYLMVQRGPAISDPGKWTFPGGAIDSKETPHQGAARETIEELGLKDDVLKDALVHGDHTFTVPGSTWKYTTVAAQVPTMIKPNLSTAHARAETSDAKWMTEAEIKALDTAGKLHHPIAGGKLEQNVLSLYPQAAGPGVKLGQVARPGPVTKRQGRLGMPSGGRQAPATFNAWPHPHKPSTGKNLVADKAAIDAMRQKVKQDRALFDAKTADGRLAAIGAIQGFDAAPTVMDEKDIDRLLATGDYIEAWRGVSGAGGGWSARSRGGSGGKSAADINEEMRSGPAYYGKGIFGNGYYLATNKRVAQQYSDGTHGSVVRILIPKSAITDKYDKVEKEAQANSTRTSKAKGSSGYELSTFWDPGRWGAAKGLDGIEINPHHRAHAGGGAAHVASHGKPAFNWLNRSVLILQKEPG